MTAATIGSWKKKSGGNSASPPAARGSSRELKALQELAEILVELEKTEAHLEKLQKNYNKAKAKL